MSDCEQEPTAAADNFPIEMPSIESLTTPVLIAFGRALAEAQLLECAIVKGAIGEDVKVFATANDQQSLLKVLETLTLGRAERIFFGGSTGSNDKKIAACIGFLALVKLQWRTLGGTEAQLPDFFGEVVKRRNRIAHYLLDEVIGEKLTEADALAYLERSQQLFAGLRELVISADALSSRLGGIATDGSGISRFKTTE